MKSVGLLIVAAMVAASGACAQSARKAAAQPNVLSRRSDKKAFTHKSLKINEVARPGRLELPTLCLEGVANT